MGVVPTEGTTVAVEAHMGVREKYVHVCFLALTFGHVSSESEFWLGVSVGQVLPCICHRPGWHWYTLNIFGKHQFSFICNASLQALSLVFPGWTSRVPSNLGGMLRDPNVERRVVNVSCNDGQGDWFCKNYVKEVTCKSKTNRGRFASLISEDNSRRGNAQV